MTKSHFIAVGEVTFKSLLFIPNTQASETFLRQGHLLMNTYFRMDTLQPYDDHVKITILKIYLVSKNNLKFLFQNQHSLSIKYAFSLRPILAKYWL